MTDRIGGGVPAPGTPLKVIDKDKTLTDAIRLAGQHQGSEVVVGYVDENQASDQRPIHYAVVDMGPALPASHAAKAPLSSFNPASLHFGDGIKVVSAVVVNGQEAGKVDRNVLDKVQFFDVDPDIQTETVLALADAAATRLGDAGANRQIEGFGMARTTTDWVKMVHQNRAVVLQQMSATLSGLEGTIAEKETALKAALKANGTGEDLLVLKQELETLKGQRDELTTFQGVIRVDLLTDARDDGIKVPGMQTREGKPVTAGAWRNVAGAKQAVSVLVDEKAVLQGRLYATSDPMQQARIERQIATLDGAIEGITFKTADALRAQGQINRRMAALGVLGEAIDHARDQVEGMKAALKSPAANPLVCASQADKVREQLIATFQTQRNAFKSAEGAKEAVAFLDKQIEELRQLPKGNVDGLLDKINAAQASLLQQIKGMARIIDRVTPGEGRMLAQIGNGVDDFRTAYQSVQRAAVMFETFAKKLGEDAGSQGFRLSQGAIDGLSAAMHWDPLKGGASPFATNQFIVGQYAETSKELRAYIGIDVPDWYAVGAKACNQVGGQVAELMTVEAGLATIMTHDGTIANDLRAGEHLIGALMDTWPQLKPVFLDKYGPEAAMALDKALRTGSVKPLKDYAHDLQSLVTELRQGFVEGNVRIAQNVLTARKVFFEAEFAGDDGVAALKQYAKTHPAFDPEGYMVDAYRCIQQAKDKVEAGDQAGASKLILKANASIAMQEQSTFLQTKNTFGNRSMRLVLDKAGSASALSLEKADGNGAIQYGLVNDWTKLHVRMGMSYVGEAAFKQNEKDGKDGSLYFKLTIKPDQRLEVEPAMNLKPEQTFVDEQGRSCVKPGVTLYLQLPPDAPMGTAGRLFIEASKGGEIGKSMLVRPAAPEGPTYTYNPDDGMLDLAGDAVKTVWHKAGSVVGEIFEGADDEAAKLKKVQSLAVNGGFGAGQATTVMKPPVAVSP